MAMVKIISPSGWDFDAPIASTIKIASRGLTGADRSDFVKRAGDASNIFLPYLLPWVLQKLMAPTVTETDLKKLRANRAMILSSSTLSGTVTTRTKIHSKATAL
jgi:hypothetical protein